MTDGKDHHVRLGEDERALLVQLRAKRRHQRVQAAQAGPPLTRGQIIADAVAATMGSWPFIIIQTTILAAWITLNIVAWIRHWDPYPFILLNLALSFQAAYAAPFIMMSQNRQADVDRLKAEEDYKVNIKAELEIELLHQKIDELREREVLALVQSVERLTALLEGQAAPPPGQPAPEDKG
ncbi:MAG: hypothetical protein QOE79_434 [Sphingomonadales bacterium]|jgi:uncharacterized membrane protein|nr:hypothetical protein [Sphingomonadales bacterium]MEA3050228.1 hypothetical protein [Sphingomonadales bacterium]